MSRASFRRRLVVARFFPPGGTPRLYGRLDARRYQWPRRAAGRLVLADTAALREIYPTIEPVYPSKSD